MCHKCKAEAASMKERPLNSLIWMYVRLLHLPHIVIIMT